MVAVSIRQNSLTIRPFTDFPERFCSMDSLSLYGKDMQVRVDVRGVSIRDGFVFVEIGNGYDLHAFKGMYVKVPKDELYELPKDTFYVFDIIGCKVYLEGGGLVGEVIDVIRTGSNDVYQVHREGKKDLFIPALKSVILRVDLKDKRIYVKLPEGLMEIYES